MFHGSLSLARLAPALDTGSCNNARLTDAGWAKVVDTAPGHVRNVRKAVIDKLTPEQLDQLGEISRALLAD